MVVCRIVSYPMRLQKGIKMSDKKQNCVVFFVCTVAAFVAFRVVACDYSLLGIPYLCSRKNFFRRNNFYNKKYVALSFDQAPAGGGLRHVENKYIRPIFLISQMTGRIPIFPPPHMCLEAKHNNNKTVDTNDSWTDYYDTICGSTFLPFFPLPDGFKYLENGQLKIDASKHSSVHHSAKKPFHNGFFEKIDDHTDNDYDVIVFDSHSPRVWKGMDAAVRHLELRGEFATVPSPLPSASNYRELALKFSERFFGLNPFVFFHIRRGDYVGSFDIGRCTSAKNVASTIKMFRIKHVFVATNEKSPGYIPSIRHNSLNYKIYGEENVYPLLPENIRTNNYKVFLFLDSLARLSKMNIATRAHRLGKKIDYYLCGK